MLLKFYAALEGANAPEEGGKKKTQTKQNHNWWVKFTEIKEYIGKKNLPQNHFNYKHMSLFRNRLVRILKCQVITIF